MINYGDMRLIETQLLDSFEATAQQESLQKAAQQLLDAWGIRVREQGKIRLVGPVILVSNHPGSIDHLVIQSAVPRPDFYITALASYSWMGSQLQSHLLPIYRQPNYRDRLLGMVMRGVHEHAVREIDEVRRRNKAIINKAAELVDSGHAVVIFPTGTGGKKPLEGAWKVGVGFLANKIINRETSLIFARIEGTHMTDIARFVDQRIRRKVFREKEVTLTFSEPIPISSLKDQNLDGIQMTKHLEELYTLQFEKTS